MGILISGRENLKIGDLFL